MEPPIGPRLPFEIPVDSDNFTSGGVAFTLPSAALVLTKLARRKVRITQSLKPTFHWIYNRPHP